MSLREFMRAAEALPFRHLDEAMPGKRTLVLAPHPDDESIGCGGLIATLAEHGVRTTVLVLSDGAGSHPGSARYPGPVLSALRREEAREAVAILGGETPQFLDWPDGAVPLSGLRFERAVQQVTAAASGCDAIFTTAATDPHVDHVATFQIARRVASSLGVRLLAYPVWSWRYLYPELGPIEEQAVQAPPSGFRLDIAKHLARKRQAVFAHRSQTSPLVEDAPAGFLLTTAMLAIFIRPFEVFLEAVP